MIADKVRKTIKSKLGLRNDVTDDMTLAIDLGCDELDMVEIMMDLEKVLHFQMPSDMLECFDPMGTMTVADLIRAVEDSAPVRLFDNKIPLNPIAGLYTMRGGVPVCCLTGDKCKKLSKNEIKQNTALYNLCRRRSSIIESNFQRLAQKVK